jgi:hypothetical protein
MKKTMSNLTMSDINRLFHIIFQIKITFVVFLIECRRPSFSITYTVWYILVSLEVCMNKRVMETTTNPSDSFRMSKTIILYKLFR